MSVAKCWNATQNRSLFLVDNTTDTEATERTLQIPHKITFMWVFSLFRCLSNCFLSQGKIKNRPWKGILFPICQSIGHTSTTQSAECSTSGTYKYVTVIRPPSWLLGPEEDSPKRRQISPPQHGAIAQEHKKMSYVPLRNAHDICVLLLLHNM